MNEIKKIDEMNLFNLTEEKIELIKRTACKGASDDELQLFLHVCSKSGLDPFIKQIYSIPREVQIEGKRTIQRTIQTSIDGLRLIADRTGKYAPGQKPTYIYDDNKRLISATSFIKKMTNDGTWHEVSASAIVEEYHPGERFWRFWKKMPHVMIAKCAEALALRKAFPAEMCNLYIKEEMDQAEMDVAEIEEKEDPKKEEENLLEYIQFLPEEEQEYAKTYLKRYSSHWKKSLTKAIADYQNQEQFVKDLAKWKKQQENKAA